MSSSVGWFELRSVRVLASRVSSLNKLKSFLEAVGLDTFQILRLDDLDEYLA